MKRINWNDLNPRERQDALRRPALSEVPERAQRVAEIIKEVRVDGDAAVFMLTEELDGASLKSLEVDNNTIERAWAGLDSSLRSAMTNAADRITKFHKLQKPVEIQFDTGDGTALRRKPVPISRVGLYVPAGSAPLPSTVLMTAIPAKIAGCPLIVLAAPPGRDGEIASSILAAARLCGVDRVFRIGGAQAIAAMAYGTETVPKTDKIFGPGSAWVAEAKRQVAQDPEGAVADMPAGPSEVMVVVDNNSDPVFAAADLLSQAEHGADSQAVLVALDEKIAAEVDAELGRQVVELPRRTIAAESLSKSVAVLVRTEDAAIEVIESYAPEHLLLQTARPRELADRVSSAGSVFIGRYSPEAAGDYAAGTNHVLPTYGAARAVSGLGVESFMRWISFQESTREGLEAMADSIEELAKCEGLEGHRRAVAVRRGAKNEAVA
ncbi:MAG: histidinol dehydrogenase [Elusimicrobia bacterium]|nr:MAG: histidinol dehydrogenase [Elusimicrobiota bacterium]